MVLFRGEVHQLALEAAQHHCGQGGELQAAGGQFHPGHGPKAASVSTGTVSTDSLRLTLKVEICLFWGSLSKMLSCNWSSRCLAHGLSPWELD